VEGGNSFYPQVTGIASVRCKVHYNLSPLGKDSGINQRAPPLTQYFTPPNSNRVLRSLPCQVINPTNILWH